MVYVSIRFTNTVESSRSFTISNEFNSGTTEADWLEWAFYRFADIQHRGFGPGQKQVDTILDYDVEVLTVRPK